MNFFHLPNKVGMPLQYTTIYVTVRQVKLEMKKCDIFLNLSQNIHYGNEIKSAHVTLLKT